MDQSRAIIPKHFRQCGSFSNIVTKFDDDPMKNIWVTERTTFILAILANSRAITPKCFIDSLKNIQVKEGTRFILANLANSRAITPKCLMRSGWLSNFAEIFCQQTFSQSLMIIQWKHLKLLSGQMLWTPLARRTCSHNTSRAYKKTFSIIWLIKT